MKSVRRPLVLLGVAALAAATTACGAQTAGSGGGTAATPVTSSASGGAASTPASPAAPGTTSPGAYVEWAEYQDDPAARADTKVVLFFHASWCPSCRATEKAIAESGVPAGLTLVKVDYDTATDLRQRYGVTTQHTFVQVDGSGGELAKWTGSEDGAAVLAETV